MLISVSNHNQNFEPVSIETLEDLAQHMLRFNYSFGVFKNNNRTNASFLKADGVALDFDGGLSLNEAKLRFNKYKHIIATTRSHQIEKNGVIDDRFRVVLFLDNLIDNGRDFKQTVRELLKKNPEADGACIDPARMFYPSTNIVSIKHKGLTIPVHSAPDVSEIDRAVFEGGARGSLRPDTKRFFMEGATKGERNNSLFKAAKDCQGQGYTEDEVLTLVQNMKLLGVEWPYTMEKDKETISNAFKETSNDEPRIKESCFNFTSVSELYRDKTQLEWQVDRLCLKGGLTLLCGIPKSGKSTLVRQLAKATLRGESFLNRRVTKGRVLHIALEEHPYMLRDQMKTVGIKDSDDLILHIGPLSGSDITGQLIYQITKLNPTLVIIDTLTLFSKFENLNDYSIVNSSMELLRSVARETNTHVMAVHHTNKMDGGGTNSIMGSQAIFGAIDAAIIFNRVGVKRFIQTEGRGTYNLTTELEFNSKNETYTIKALQNSNFNS